MGMNPENIIYEIPISKGRNGDLFRPESFIKVLERIADTFPDSNIDCSLLGEPGANIC